MPDIPLHFPWHVAEGGYHWFDARTASDPHAPRRQFLSHGRPMGAEGYSGWRYQPLSAHTGLFREFAGTEPGQAGIKAFADRFGPLGPDIEKPIVLGDQGNRGRASLAMGESLADWTDEILTMRLAIDLWEAARNGDVEQLERWISWTEDGRGVRMISHPELPEGQLPDPPDRVELAWIASSLLDDDVLGRFVRGDLVKPALHYVQGKINAKLEGRASPRLLWEADRDRLGLYIVPDGLIGALWLQLARAVERDSRFRQCAECGIWFELARGTARADKLYCSTPCRTKAYRKRQAEAVRLHDEGRSLEEIARALDSDPETVKGWIERKAGSGTPNAANEG
jgi:hypothetical protein